jgi:hypothetical protein
MAPFPLRGHLANWFGEGVAPPWQSYLRTLSLRILKVRREYRVLSKARGAAQFGGNHQPHQANPLTGPPFVAAILPSWIDGSETKPATKRSEDNKPKGRKVILVKVKVVRDAETADPALLQRSNGPMHAGHGVRNHGETPLTFLRRRRGPRLVPKATLKLSENPSSSKLLRLGFLKEGSFALFSKEHRFASRSDASLATLRSDARLPIGRIP